MRSRMAAGAALVKPGAGAWGGGGCGAAGRVGLSPVDEIADGGAVFVAEAGIGCIGSEGRVPRALAQVADGFFGVDDEGSLRESLPEMRGGRAARGGRGPRTTRARPGGGWFLRGRR